MMPKTETSGDDAAEECSTTINWEEDPAITQNGKEEADLQLRQL